MAKPRGSARPTPVPGPWLARAWPGRSVAACSWMPAFADARAARCRPGGRAWAPRCSSGTDPARTPASFHMDRDPLRHQRRFERNVVGMAQFQLQGVSAGCERDRGFGLATAKVDVLRIVRNRLARRRQLLHVDQQVMVPGALLAEARRRHAHALEAKAHGDVL